MGLIKAAAAAMAGTMDDIWKELFACDALPMETLMVRGTKRISSRSANTGGSPDVITHGSVILVADGQCALVVSGGRVIDSCSEPGEYVFHDPEHAGGVGGLLREAGQRFAFGGDAPPRSQRVYYVNVKECLNVPFSLERPIDLRAAGVDPLFGTVRCSGVFSYRISDPLRFYKLLAGNVSGRYDRSKLNGQLSAQLAKLLGPALNTLCIEGLRPSEIPARAEEVSRAVREASAGSWLEEHGLELVSVAVSSLTPSGGDMDIQRAFGRNSALLGARVPGEEPEEAAPGEERTVRERTGPEAPPEPAAPEKSRKPWTCLCGRENTGNFCRECGRPRKWTCPCGAENTGRFCTECGKARTE